MTFRILRFAFLLASTACTSAASQCESSAPSLPGEVRNTVSLEDFRPIIGDGWEGELEYLNFGKESRSTIPVRMIVEEPTGNTQPYAFLYPGEEDKNATDGFKISPDGREVDGLKVVSWEETKSGARKLVTEGPGDDDGAPSTVRVTIEFSPKLFVLRKDIQGSDGAFFNRNEYRLRR